MPVGEEERRHPVLAGSPRAVGRECHRWSGKGRRARARPRPRRLPPALVLAPPYLSSPATLHGHPDPVAHACSRGPGTAATAKRTRGRLCGRATEREAEKHDLHGRSKRIRPLSYTYLQLLFDKRVGSAVSASLLPCVASL